MRSVWYDPSKCPLLKHKQEETFKNVYVIVMRLKRVLLKSEKSWIKKNCFHLKKVLKKKSGRGSKSGVAENKGASFKKRKEKVLLSKEIVMINSYHFGIPLPQRSGVVLKFLAILYLLRSFAFPVTFVLLRHFLK